MGGCAGPTPSHTHPPPSRAVGDRPPRPTPARRGPLGISLLCILGGVACITASILGLIDIKSALTSPAQGTMAASAGDWVDRNLCPRMDSERTLKRLPKKNAAGDGAQGLWANEDGAWSPAEGGSWLHFSEHNKAKHYTFTNTLVIIAW